MIQPKLISVGFHEDRRGEFYKPFGKSVIDNLEVNFEVREVFFSTNRKHVLRGFHFQKRPYDHAKIVFVLQGRVLDVIIDLRRSSPTFGQTQQFELAPECRSALFIPTGFAHAFLSLEDQTLVGYLQETERVETAESGILWNSTHFKWPVADPILSERDLLFPKLEHLPPVFT